MSEAEYSILVKSLVQLKKLIQQNRFTDCVDESLFFAKLLIIAIALSTDDGIMILDPEGEYTPLVQALGGAAIRFAIGARTGGMPWKTATAKEVLFPFYRRT